MILKRGSLTTSQEVSAKRIEYKSLLLAFSLPIPDRLSLNDCGIRLTRLFGLYGRPNQCLKKLVTNW